MKVPGLVQDLRSFRIVGHGANRRPGIHEVSVSPGRDVLDEALDDAERILQPVPARNLQHHRILRPQRSFFQQLRRAAHGSRRAVLAGERGVPGDTGAVVEPGHAQDRADRTIVEFLILCGERVDHRSDQLDPRAVEPLPDERLAREYVRVGRLDVGSKEGPCTPRQRTRRIDPDVTTPDHGHADLLEPRYQSGRLRVVNDHHVATIHQLRKFRSARLKRVLVLLALGIAEIATIARHRMQVVVNSLGHGEERLAAGGHQPTRINTGPVGIRQQRDQHLSDAPAASSRVHIPDHATLEQPTGALRRHAHRLVTVRGKHRFETLKAEAADRDGLEHAHAPILAQQLEATQPLAPRPQPSHPDRLNRRSNARIGAVSGGSIRRLPRAICNRLD